MNTLADKQSINIAGNRILLNSIVSYCESVDGDGYYTQKYPIILIKLISGHTLTLQTETNVSDIIRYLDTHFETVVKFK